MQDFVACKVMVLPIAEPKPFLLKIKKNVLVMKITAVLLLAALQVSARGWGQEQITLSLNNVPLEQVFSAITAQTSIAFLYRPEYIKDKKVTLKITNASLKTVLEACLKDQKLVYEIVGKTVAIHPANKVNAVSNTESAAPPPVDIKGRIVDSKGEAIPNATVSVKGSVKNTITNANGEFTLSDVDENAVLVISHVQYELESIVLKGNKNITVSLQIKVNSLDEMQVIAYGTTTRRFNTGNISTVKSKDIEKQPVANVLGALEGRVPGMVIIQQSGVPGGGFKVQIRGQNSISQNNDPLYVIDGVPYTSNLLTNAGTTIIGSGSPFNYINPSDIESIDVLKDADATAIYGSRGANGVVLIATKKGKTGTAKVDINISTGIGHISRKAKLLNREQYLQMRQEAFNNDGVTPISSNAPDITVWDTTRNTDWQDELIGGNAKYTNATASISGGNPNTQYFFGTNYHRETTVFPGNFYDSKISIHFNISTTSSNRKFKAMLSGSYLLDNDNLPKTDITSGILISPVAPSGLDSLGRINYANGLFSTNPYFNLLSPYKAKVNNLVSNAFLSYEFLPGFELKTSFGYTNMQMNEIKTSTIAAQANPNVLNKTGTASFSYNNINSWIVEPQITYSFNLGKGKFNALLGSTFQENILNGQIVDGQGYTTDALLWSLAAAATISKNSSTYEQYRYNAFYGRINYNYQDKYLLNLTSRRDGSSRFGPGKQFANFGAVGAGWLFSKEPFVEHNLPFLSFGKLRASYGIVGNQPAASYGYLELYNFNTGSPAYQGGQGLLPSNIFAPDFAWENVKKLEGGVELGVFRDRILLSVSYFQNCSSNQLVSYSLPSLSGFNNITANLPAKVQNTGLEITLNTVNIKINNFSWSSSFNLTASKNKLVDFPNIQNTPYKSLLIIGQPINLIRTFRMAGVDQQTGVYQFYDSSDNLTFAPSFNKDQNAIIVNSPKFYGGFQNNFTYKGFELDLFFQYVKQIGNNNIFAVGTSTPGYSRSNQPIEVINRWQKSGDITSIQKFSTSNTVEASSAYQYALQSDAAYSDASFIRLKNAAISYFLPKSWQQKMHLQNCKVYLQGQNLLTFSPYKGVDPENQSITALPPLRVLTAGIQITL